jgi:hypothetical protein
MDMGTFSALNFGQIITYLIPGFIGAYALAGTSTFLNKIKSITFIDPTKINETAVLLIVSVAVGLIINAFRLAWVDKLVIRLLGEKFNYDYSKLKNKDIRDAYNDIVQHAWQFTQFYGNMMIAMTILFLFNANLYFQHFGTYWRLVVSLILAIWVLFLTFKRQFKTVIYLNNAIFDD